MSYQSPRPQRAMQRTMGFAGAFVVLGLASGGVVAGAAPSDREVLGGEWRERYAAGQAERVRRGTPPSSTPIARGATREQIDASRRAHTGRKGPLTVARLARDGAPALAGSEDLVPESARIDEILASNIIALKTPGGQEPAGVVLSDLPLAVPGPNATKGDLDWRPADLRWTANEAGGFRVRRAVGAITAPARAGGQVRVGPIAFALADSDSPAIATVPDGAPATVVYPSVDASSASGAGGRDLVLASLPDGFRAGLVLRSIDAGQSWRVRVELPDGFRLRTTDGEGELRIDDRDGRRVGRVQPIGAVAGDGTSVPVSTTIVGTTIVYRIETPLQDLVLPVVADPQVQLTASVLTTDPLFPAVNSTWNGSDTDFSGWRRQLSRPSMTNMKTLASGTGTPSVNGLWMEGLAASVGTGAGLYNRTPRDYAAWLKIAPGNANEGTWSTAAARKTSLEHGFWWRADVVYDYQALNSSPARWADPGAVAGYWSRNAAVMSAQKHERRTALPATYGTPIGGAFETNYIFESVLLGQGFRIYLGANADTPPTGTAATDAASNLFDFGLVDRDWNTVHSRPQTAARIAAIKLYAGDNVAPKIVAPAGAPGWLSEEDELLSVQATDQGTGVRRLAIENPAGAPLPLAVVEPVCDGASVRDPLTDEVIGSRICPFDTGVMDMPLADVPEGANQQLVARDATGKVSVPMVVKIDRGEPDLTLSGDLFTQRATEHGLTETRPLVVNTADGVPTGGLAAQRSGVARVEVYVDDELVHEVDQAGTGDSLPLDTTWTPPADTFTAGEYVVRVIAYDGVGHEKEAAFTVNAPCCGEDLDAQDIDAGTRLYRFGDVNGDGVADVVLVDKATGATAIRGGAGDGTFGAEQAWGSLSTTVLRIAVGDLSGDGKADLVAQTTTGGLERRLSDGTTFIEAPTMDPTTIETSWPVTRSLAMADLDGDSLTDIWGLDSASRVLWVAHAGDGALLPAEDLITIPGTRDVEVGDLDGDGSADLVTYEPSDGVVRFRSALEDEHGFGPSETWGTGPDDADLALGDVNGDELADVIFRVPGGSSPDEVTARTSSIEGGFTGPALTLGAIPTTFGFLTQDVDGDSRDDALGTRLVGTTLQVRSIASRAPDLWEDDPFEPDVPEDEEDPDFGALSARSPDPKTMSYEISAQDDRTLIWGANRSVPIEAALDQLKHVGVSKLRIFLWWGQVDRLHPSSTLEDVATDEVALAQYPDGGMKNYSPAAGIAAPDTTTNPPSAVPSGAASKKVRERWLWGPYDQIINKAHDKGMSVHITLSGATWWSYAECDSLATAAMAIHVPRGCIGTGAANGQPGGTFVNDPAHYRPTGWNPDPAQYRHFVHEAVKHFKTLPGGSAVESVGLWNEPNATNKDAASRYLTVTNTPSMHLRPSGGKNGGPYFVQAGDHAKGIAGANRDTAVRYGELYAAGYNGVKAASPAVKVLFGETSPQGNQFPGGKNTAPTWIRKALQSAKSRWGAEGNPGVVPITDAYAIHPYQHLKRPWRAPKRDVFGVYGVGKKTGNRPDGGSRSLRGWLQKYAQDKLISSRPTTAATGSTAARPRIWATEFGYYSVKDGKVQGDTHTEIERRNWLRDAPSSRPKEQGALHQLVMTAKVPVVNFWNVFERPPNDRLAGLIRVRGEQDTGFVGSLPRGRPGTPEEDPVGGWSYSGPELAVKGTRNYGKVWDHVSELWHLNSTPQRRVGCEIRRWVMDRGHRSVKGFAATRTIPPNGPRRCV